MNVTKSQSEGKRMQAHYLSPSSQNEFIHLCAEKSRKKVRQEVLSSKYYSLLLDGTPDLSCQEQSTFIFRYLLYRNGVYIIKVNSF